MVWAVTLIGEARSLLAYLQERTMHSVKLNEIRNLLRRLTNKDVLFKVATSDPEGRVRYAAAGCYYKVMGGFDAKGVMRAVHMREYLLAATEAAIKGVKSQAKLKKLARDYKDPEIRAVALTNLTDMATLAEILLGETDDRVRRAALDRGRILFGDQYC